MVKYIIDYDIPLEPSAKRIMFYRRLKKLTERHKGDIEKSTDSVVITSNKALAGSIYNLAEAFGEANIYEVSKKSK